MPKRTIHIGTRSHLLDVRPDRLDLRDREYLPPVLSLPPQFPESQTLSTYLFTYVRSNLILDQGSEGACTGYGLAAVVNYMLWTRALVANNVKNFRSVSPHMLYDLAQFYDEWPGEDYEGSSCRGAMKGWYKHGVCEALLWKESVRRKPKAPRKKYYVPDSSWPFNAASRPVGVYYRVNRQSVVDMQAAILNMGAIYVSADVHAGWDLGKKSQQKKALGHANLPVILFSEETKISGGHSFALVGYNEIGFVVQNSWGTGWGASGFAIMTYADWITNGADAWVCSLGVPQVTQPTGAAVITSAPSRQLGVSLLSGDSQPSGKSSTAGTPPWPVQRAYQHTVVAGNNGLVRMSMPDIGNAEGLVDLIMKDHLGQWLKDAAKPARKVVIYAHGGLNNEEDSINHIRVMAPYFLGNGVYPLFYTWRTGLLETIESKLQDALGIAAAENIATGLIGDAKDYLLEATAHAARWVWNEMKNNAAEARNQGHALDLMITNMTWLQTKYPGTEFHLVGHSAGSFIHGYLCDMMVKAKIKPASLTLFAPACSLAFANLHFVAPKPVPANKVWLHVLSDQREKEDSAGPYGKSLLYLVCRGFEDVRKTPIAGLQHCVDISATHPDDDLWQQSCWPQVSNWRNWVNSLPPQADGRPAFEQVTSDQISTGEKSIPASHGSFDNNKEVIERTINRILGNAPDATLAVPIDDLGY
jgi:Papain family cysteine protease